MLDFDSNGSLILNVGDDVLKDLKQRLGNTRWPDEIANQNWDYGTNMSYLKELVTYWENDFDWRKQESWLNTFNHFKTDVDGIDIHYIHQQSSDKSATPLLLLHGWPGSFLQMLNIIPLLVDPSAHGLPNSQSFHVVVASLPGYGFSNAATHAGMAMEKIAHHMATLMTKNLGYKQYGVRGSDLGGTVIDQMARHYPEQIIGAHLSGIIVAGPVPVPNDATRAEIEFLDACASMGVGEMAYARQHASKPQTLAYSLNDSPAGLAAWIIEKYRSWGDTGGNIESRFSKDYLLTMLTIYWVTQTINSSIRLYYELVRNRGNTDRIMVPVGMLMNGKDMFPAAPREFAERSHNIVHWSEAKSGGHFLEWEEPELVARDIQQFFAGLKLGTYKNET